MTSSLLVSNEVCIQINIFCSLHEMATQCILVRILNTYTPIKVRKVRVDVGRYPVLVAGGLYGEPGVEPRLALTALLTRPTEHRACCRREHRPRLQVHRQRADVDAAHVIEEIQAHLAREAQGRCRHSKVQWTRKS